MIRLTAYLVVIAAIVFVLKPGTSEANLRSFESRDSSKTPFTVRRELRKDVSKPLSRTTITSAGEMNDHGAGRQSLAPTERDPTQNRPTPTPTPTMTPVTAASAAIEQRSQGPKPAARLVESFDGLGFGFEGPQGVANLRNPSDNTLAVGPDHVVQIVNTRMAVFSKKGKRFQSTGKALYGPVVTRAVFAGFGGQCEARNNGDAVVRYDQLANRWLIVMPIFARGPVRPDQPPVGKSGDPAAVSPPGRPNQPGNPVQIVPPKTQANPADPNRAGAATSGEGPYSMCYAVSTSPDPLGQYYRYEFLRPFFPDYPRPAVWPDGYYNPTSTSDYIIQKHACVVERNQMLKGLPATEQCFVIDGVNFLNNADIDGYGLPPGGAPNIMMAAGGAQLKGILEDDKVFYWKFHVDWKDPANTKLDGPFPIAVAPYQYLCGGQLTDCVPQPGIDRRLDSQGDKIMYTTSLRHLPVHQAPNSERVGSF